MACNICGSWAINHGHHGRDGSDPTLCDVCYWRQRCEQCTASNAAKDDEIDRLRAEVSRLTEANRYLIGISNEAMEDARKYAEARLEIARLREALVATFDALDRSSSPFPLSIEMTLAALDHAKAALSGDAL